MDILVHPLREVERVMDIVVHKGGVMDVLRQESSIVNMGVDKRGVV